ncbi:acyl-ACP--UDP-N-acetylglucosamine O-acyltransferase [Telmatospirillum sp.]|uniref:acyl-ACP--UDP-N-acetylglucosamine O-acyltransferase n=1 Tax=Telmatospirillum sp. TaxID=2079197 RepID=UPI00283D8F37|nr:acyl-ACP--UDP-N-acetylglucosamine O-acyltransferase [Telmatospirillum sp.]MDR3436695.1 acyl-ACP--UDP-N-acetylglucosamine O-acyltransferase [Telmatospirillum sp.]
MASIHPTAIISSGAKIAQSVTIGPYCLVGENVEIAEDVQLISHVVVEGITSIGEGTVVYPFASLGHRPQDLKYKGEPSRLVIGKHNQIRETVTMNPGTEGGGMLTKVGDNGLFMMGAHVAHDCQVGDGVIFANNATLGGHVHVGDFVVLGGLSAVHQFVRIGRHVMVGGMSGVENDVIPYATVTGNRAHLSGLNLVGLKRRGFSREDIHALRNAYRLLFAPEGTMAERVEEVANQFRSVAPVMEILDFISTDSSRAICQPKLGAVA